MGIGNQLVNVVLNGFREGVNVIIDFEKANSKLAGVLGSTKAGIAGLTDEARRLGSTTAYTASDVTGLQVELEFQIFQLLSGFFVAFLLVDQEFCCTFAVALFGNESEKAV